MLERLLGSFVDMRSHAALVQQLTKLMRKNPLVV